MLIIGALNVRRSSIRRGVSLRLVSALILLLTLPLQAKESISFLINPSSATQQRAYFELVVQFEKTHPDFKVILVTQKPEIFKQTIADFIADGKAPADMMLVYAGQQLRLLHANNRIQSLDDIGLGDMLNSAFSRATLESVATGTHRLAIPFSYYHWGIYYNSAIFKGLSLNVPATMTELLKLVKTLRKHQITPFSFCPDSPWTLLAWLDYLNLRINGLDMHRALLSGKLSFKEPPMQKVLGWWLQLVNAGAFDSNARQNWQECLPYLYRGMTGMTLMGNFALARMPKQQQGKLGFFGFPRYENNKTVYEDVPLDVIVINQRDVSAAKEQAIRQFAQYLIESDTQSRFNRQVDKIAPHLNSYIGDAPFIQLGKALIDSSDGYMHYFDRETPAAFSNAVAQILINSVIRPVELQSLTEQLEAQRQNVFNSQQ